MTVQDFLREVEAIQDERPQYKLGHDGSDGYCDCIGLVIGAMRRNGLEWDGTHGTNWTARNAINGLMRVYDAADLNVGDLVFKARAPGADGYDLPSKYAKDPDPLDYYHVGVVMSVDPLKITHCTTQGLFSTNSVIDDDKLGKWTYKGQLVYMDYGMEDEPMTDSITQTRPVQTATVYAQNGKPVNLRKKPEKGADLVDRINVGEVVKVNSQSGEWAQVTHGKRTGYMMTQFLTFEKGVEGPVQATQSATVEELMERVKRLEERILSLEGGVG
mgnify:CR=1 FL=1